MRAFVLLPLIVFIILGAMILWLSLKQETLQEDLQTQHIQTKHLALHFISFKEIIKSKIQDKSLIISDFTEFSMTIHEKFHYQAIIKKFDSKLEKNSIYFVDVFGQCLFSIQPCSLRKDFILYLDTF